jgi:nicotinamidase-related amidase
VEVKADRTAVVVVHLQVDIVKRGGAVGDIFADMVDKTELVPRAARVLRAAREAGMLVVFQRICFRPGYPDLVVNNPLLDLAEQKGALVDGEPGAEIIAELAPEQNDIVVDHRRLSGFYGSDLKTVLDKRGIDTLLVLGVATNVSVEATSRAAIDLGYTVVVLEDCCAADSKETHEASISTLGLLASSVTTSEAFFGAVQLTGKTSVGSG